MFFGKQRLVSPLDWSNTRRTFDGVSGIFQVNYWTVTGFWTRFVPVQKYDFNDSYASTALFGIYATGKAPGSAIGVDLYWLGLQRDAAAVPGGGFNGSFGDEDRYTVGGRLFGNIADTGLDYDLEGAYQFGQVGSSDIDALMIAGEMGYLLADLPFKPRVHVGASYASGDKSAAGKVKTFNQLFPLGHAYLGWIDANGRQNIIDLSPGLTFKQCKDTVVKFNAHLFWVADPSDAVYNAGAGVLRAGGTSSEVGSELDLFIKHQFNKHLVLILGYNHFSPVPTSKSPARATTSISPMSLRS